MIKIIILNSLRNKIYKIFKQDSLKVYKKIKQLKNNPNKGKILAHIGTITLREIRHNTFRLYYTIDKNKLNLFNQEKLEELLIKFIELSKKNKQQKTIDKLKEILKKLN
jgi:mRNA-degrading endonuclease RelE of RelBE toxin-antitoxin system